MDDYINQIASDYIFKTVYKICRIDTGGNLPQFTIPLLLTEYA